MICCYSLKFLNSLKESKIRIGSFLFEELDIYEYINILLCYLYSKIPIKFEYKTSLGVYL